jgi:putative transposase
METGVDRPRWRFWQNGGGYDRNIRDHRELRRVIDYVHENPVKKGLVEKPEDWFWSSARDWMYGTDEGPIPIERVSCPIM